MEGKSKLALGKEGEVLAREYLKQNGYELLATNYRVGKRGEIDIIAREREFLCFVEVKTRKSRLYGMPSEAVDRRKQERMIFLAQCFVKTQGLRDCNIRFDIVEILYQPSKGPEINLIRNAF